jgi:prefoldin subunit 5
MQTEDNKELILLRSKVNYLEDRIEVMARSIGSINKILGRFQITEGKQSNDPFIKVMEQGEKDYELI